MMTTNAQSDSRDERGYTLLGLLALATIIMIFATAAAPSIKQQTQREREEEAIFRGEQVAEAIRTYITRSNNQIPNRMEQLQEGVSVPGRTRRLQVLRPSAARDPLSSDGEWRVVISTVDRRLSDFGARITAYNNGIPPTTTDQKMLPFVPQGITIISDDEGQAPNDEDVTANSSGPIIGVTSRSRRQSIINYYGISRHDHWVFTPLFK